MLIDVAYFVIDTLEIREIPTEQWKKSHTLCITYNIAGVSSVITVTRSRTISNTGTFVGGIGRQNFTFCFQSDCTLGEFYSYAFKTTLYNSIRG